MSEAVSEAREAAEEVPAVSREYKKAFDRVEKVVGVRVRKGQMQDVSRTYKDYRYSRRGVRPVVDDPNGCTDTKIFLIANRDEPALAALEGDRVEVDMKVTAENFSTFEILSEMLPGGITVPGSFEAVGHIAHINLKDEHHPYRFLIGQVLLDKNPVIKTVVNKLGTIGSEFREFQFELLAGDAAYNAVVKQHKCTFRVPYDKVYWNSRLQTEHSRLVKALPKSDLLADVMAGVGPFAVPAAMAGMTVHANDLNPASFEAMKENVKLNDVSKRATCYCMDGRVFIRHIRDTYLRCDAENGDRQVHFVMNLPATAVLFLDAFQDWAPHLYDVHRATVHVYCFSSAVDFKHDALQQVHDNLKEPTAHGIVNATVHHVRNVAPKKEMLCVSFTLAENKSKKRRTE
ncbi:tRNA (guanine(37)-N1)-methyltransferase [Diplonema papillatum]|nr:tRNA (guanine(37)-N1)-methyltransferase [Diplonema papillatum]|eukprot:gene22563-34527_t